MATEHPPRVRSWVTQGPCYIRLTVPALLGEAAWVLYLSATGQLSVVTGPPGGVMKCGAAWHDDGTPGGQLTA